MLNTFYWQYTAIREWPTEAQKLTRWGSSSHFRDTIDRWYTNARECITFSAVAAMIRLGKKYEEHYLRDEGLARLKLESPSKLEDFDKLDFNNPVYIRYQEHTPDPTFATINLAHECKIRSILPCLYLFAIQCDLVRIMPSHLRAP